jgi:hypothetical protein
MNFLILAKTTNFIEFLNGEGKNLIPKRKLNFSVSLPISNFLCNIKFSTEELGFPS